MAFDIETWKTRTRDRGKGLKDGWEKVTAAGATSLYAVLSAMALWPVVEALQQGEGAAALGALTGVAAGVGGNLLANLVQGWKDRGASEDDVAQELARLATEREDIRAALDTLLNQLQVVRAVRSTLSEEDREWLVQMLLQEVERLGSSLRVIEPVSADELLNVCRMQVESVVHDVRQYDSELYVHRTIEQELTAFFDNPLDDLRRNCYLIVAPAGSGKTNLLCDLARERVRGQPVVLLMGGSTLLHEGTGLVGTIRDELQAPNRELYFISPQNALHELDRLAGEVGRDALLILDAINEYEDVRQMSAAIKQLLRQVRETENRHIKVVVTCRDYYWSRFEEDWWEGVVVNELPPEIGEDEDDEAEDFSRFSVDERDRALELYLACYQITGLPVGNAAEQCRHPLLLRFFCEAYEGQDVGEVEDIRLKELFRRYWDKKRGSIAKRMIRAGASGTTDDVEEAVGECLLSLAGYMLHRNVRAVAKGQLSQVSECERYLDSQLSMYGRIRDEFIILEETTRGRGAYRMVQVAFVYEEFMEYVMARSLMRHWWQEDLDEDAILAEIEALTAKYESFAQVLGVMVYVALMLKDERDLALWSLLLDKGEDWQKVVFEAFRKLPEDQLDAGVFDALTQMLMTADEDVVLQALDTLKLKRMGRAALPSTVDIVCDLAAHERESARRRAVLVLGSTPPDRALPVLVQAVDDRRVGVRKNAVVALGKLRDARAMKYLITALKDSSRIVRREAVWTLEKVGHVQAVEPLIAALKDSDWEVRRATARLLGEVGDARAVKPLIGVLKDDANAVQQAAIRALAMLGKPAVQPLIVALKDSDGARRLGAAQALEKLGDARAVGPLIAALKDSDGAVRLGAAEALEKLGWEPPDEEHMGWYLVSTQNWEACVQLGPSAAKPLIATLKDTDKHMQWRASEALGKLGDVAMEPLIAALKDSDGALRLGVARALEKLGDARAVEPLIVALKDSDGAVRLGAAEVLEKLGDVRAVEPLIAALKDRDGAVRLGAAEALEKLGDVRAVEPLIAALKDRDGAVRLGAAEALEKLGDARAVEPLIAALKDNDRRVQLSAARALAKLGDAAVEPLIVALKDRDGAVRLGAVRALGKLGDERAVGSLIATLKDSGWYVREKAAEALWKLGEPAVEPLIAALKDTDSDVRRGAAKALGQLVDPRAVEPLIEALKDTDSDVRRGAAEALGQLEDPRAVEPLIEALKDTDSNVRRGTAEALGQLGDPRAVELLIAALKDSDSDVRCRAAAALGKLGDLRVVEPLITALKDSDRDVRGRAAEALGQPEDPRAVEPLIAALKDSGWYVREKAAEALGQLGDPRAVEPLIAALKDRSLHVRRTAAKALRSLGWQ